MLTLFIYVQGPAYMCLMTADGEKENESEKEEKKDQEREHVKRKKFLNLK